MAVVGQLVGMIRAATIAVLSSILLGVVVADPAVAGRQVVQSDVLRLESIRDDAAMTAMMPGIPVVWEIGVSANRDDGDIDVHLEVDASPDVFTLIVASCSQEWEGDVCPAGAMPHADARLESGLIELGRQPSSAARWYRVVVELVGDLGDHRADLVLHAAAFGDGVASHGAIDLPPTGRPLPGIELWLAIAAIATGIGVGAIASRRASRMGT